MATVGYWIFFFLMPFYALGSPAAFFCWLIPYSLGMTVHHSTSGSPLKAFGWLSFYIIGSASLYVGLLATQGYLMEYFLNNDLSNLWLTISMIVMVSQTVLWAVLWWNSRIKTRYNNWRTAALTALIISLLYTLPLSLFCVEEYLEKIEDKQYKIEAQLVKEERIERNKAEMAEAWKIYPQMVGFKKYPNYSKDREFLVPDPEYPPDAGKNIPYVFWTADPPEQVLDFYEQNAKDAGMKILRGTYDNHFSISGGPGVILALVATGSNNTAMIVTNTPWMKTHWEIIIFWETTFDFERLILPHFKSE